MTKNIYHFNPNSYGYGEHYFVPALTEEDALCVLIAYFDENKRTDTCYSDLWEQDVQLWQKAKETGVLPFKYTIEIVDKVIHLEVS